MLNKVQAIIESSRIFSLPMTVMSWLVIFTYSWMNSGNITLGLIALVGVCFAHLATNVFDDYFDYKSMIKQVGFNKKEYIKNTQKTKCRYLILGLLKPRDLFILALTYLAIAFLIGLFLFFQCGIGVVYFALLGGILSICYSFMSKIKLSELAVAIAYGPALFGGVYYVMTKTYSWDVFFLALPSMFMTVILLYIHTVMDYEFDKNEGKNTIANSFNTPIDSLVVLKIFLILSYISILPLCILDILDWQIFFVLLTLPLAKDLYSSLQAFVQNPSSLPEKKWYHFPMEKYEILKEKNALSFMMRIYQSRNLMMYFSLILVIAIILGLN